MTLIDAILDACDYLEASNIEPPIKRRDKREPGRREKEEAEAELMRFFARRFRRQARAVREAAERIIKADRIPFDIEELLDDPEDEAELIRLLTKMVKGGVSIFGRSNPLDINYSIANDRAAQWAARYAGELIKQIDKFTLDTVREWVSFFVENSGFTIGDLMDRLPFDEVRAERIAVTEVTRAYAQGNKEAGEEMAKEFPGVRVVKIWETNNDDLVCDICEPLNGKEVELDQEFDDGISEPPAHINCRCWSIVTTAIT